LLTAADFDDLVPKRAAFMRTRKLEPPPTYQRTDDEGFRIHSDFPRGAVTHPRVTHSKPLAAAGKQLPDSDIAPSVAPWLLLSVARARGGDLSEVMLAGSLVTASIGLGQGEIPDLGVELSVRLDEPSRDPFPHHIGLREDHGTEGNSITSWQASLDVDARRAELLQAAKIAGQRITEAHETGASPFVTRGVGWEHPHPFWDATFLSGPVIC